ncbi:MAG: cyclic nucleotide-binding domain-containing protein [Rhodospirillaceae bacterium]
MASHPHPSRKHRLRALIVRLTHPDAPTREASWVRGINVVLIVLGVLGVVLAGDPLYAGEQPWLVRVPLGCFIFEFLLQLWVVPDWPGRADRPPRHARLDWLLTSHGLVDLAGAWLIPAALLAGVGAADAELFGVLWVFKLARYSQGLAVLGRVIQIESEPLTGVLFAFVVVLLCAAVLAHLLERGTPSGQFDTLAKSLWWTITTLTTTGYGDVVPSTRPGRVLAGLVMMAGIMVFALWAGILATGFSQEMRRRAFLRTWDLVAQVPLFHDVGATVIAEVAQRLRPREVTAGSVVVRKGDSGDCMYFIVSGEIEVQLPNASPRLGDGSFFGELALITGAPRNATAVATRPTQLLILDIADFRDLAARHPVLTEAIHEEAGRRLGRPAAGGGERSDTQ